MSENTTTTKDKLLYSVSAIPDQLTYQAFQLYVFTFFFAVIGIPILQMWLVFIIWSFWNIINDPLLGALSERTKFKGKWGKRKFYLIIATIPLSLNMVLLFTVPAGFELMYFLIIIMLFELFYTLFDVNVKSLFAEMFPNEKDRAYTNVLVKGITVFAIIFASLPLLLLKPLVPLEGTTQELATIRMNYIIAGTMLAIAVAAASIVFILFGIKEKPETKEDLAKRPQFFESLKFTLKNKTFVKFTIANMMVWYVFSILITIIPLYFVFVLEIKAQSAIITISLVLALIVAALVLPIHRKLGTKIGMRNAFMVNVVLWIFLLFPYILIGGSEYIVAGVIITALNGIALSGCLFYVDMLHANVIEEDALKFGVRRSASYYGVNAFVHRFSSLLTITTIAFVFAGSGWSSYKPTPGVNVIIGLKMIIFLFPAIALGIALLFLKLYDLHGDKLTELREELKKHPELS